MNQRTGARRGRSGGGPRCRHAHARPGAGRAPSPFRGALPALLLSLLLASPAQARLGEGLRVGESGRLNLGIELDGRYDTMVGFGFFSGGAIRNPGDAIARARGTLSLNAPGPRSNLKLEGQLDWNQYLGLVVDTRVLSYFGANLQASAVFNSDGPLAFELSESFVRSDRTLAPVFGLGVISIHNAAKARVRFRPGGGALELGGSYELLADIFTPQASASRGSSGICTGIDECNPDLASAFNALTHRFGVDGRWKLLPLTALLLNVDTGLRQYPSGSSAVPNVNAVPLRALVGFGTLFSTRLSFTVRGGYNALFFSQADRDPLHTWVALGELGYRFSDSVQARAGYQRGVEPVGGRAIYFASDRGLLELTARFSRLLLTASGAADQVVFGGFDRRDVNLNASARADYHFTEWLRLSLAGAMNWRIASGSPSTGAFSYSREEISLGLATLF